MKRKMQLLLAAAVSIATVGMAQEIAFPFHENSCKILESSPSSVGMDVNEFTAHEKLPSISVSRPNSVGIAPVSELWWSMKKDVIWARLPSSDGIEPV